LSPHKVDAILIFVVSKSPPEPSFENTFDEDAVVSRSDIALVALACISDIFRSENEQRVGIINFP
jgi:hypothetical protein